MLNFQFQWPAKLVFGPGRRAEVGELLAAEGIERVLLICAKGPFRDNGLFASVLEPMEKAGLRVLQMGDIDQNPRLSSVREGAEICKREHVQCVVALGGGSVMDCAKLIAASALYDCDPYEFLWGSREKITQSLKTVMIPTIAATGTETNPSAVIVNDDTKEKYYCDCLHPYMAVFDPETTLSAPYHLIVWGAMDILSHTFEFYFNGFEGAEFQNRFSEAILLTVMDTLQTLSDKPDDVTALGELQWCAAMAWGGLCANGRMPPEMTCHWIEESFSGYFDTHHGACLGVLTPRWMQLVYRDKPSVFARFARNVMGVEEKDDLVAAAEGIERYQKWLAKVGAPDTFFDIGDRAFSDNELEHVARTANRIYSGQIGKIHRMSEGDCLALLKSGREPALNRWRT